MSFMDDMWNINLAKEIAREARPIGSASAHKSNSETGYVPNQYQGNTERGDILGLFFLIFKALTSLLVMGASLTGFFVIANAIGGIWAGVGTVAISFFLMIRILLSWMGYIRQD